MSKRKDEKQNETSAEPPIEPPEETKRDAAALMVMTIKGTDALLAKVDAQIALAESELAELKAFADQVKDNLRHEPRALAEAARQAAERTNARAEKMRNVLNEQVSQEPSK